jgi:hypothetical protein
MNVWKVLKCGAGEGWRRSGWNSMEFHPDSAWKQSSETCMILTSAESTVKKTPDDGQRSCPKHVEYYNRINLDS